jgi:hypothetical protein
VRHGRGQLRRAGLRLAEDLVQTTGTLNGPLAGRIGNGRLIPLRSGPVVVQAMVW